MPNFTKQAIEASFIKLLNQRPLNQITVKDVVEDCGVNRNTFYYHFRDLHALIEELVTEEANAIIGRYPAIASIEQCMDVAVEFAMTNKRAVLHIYNSTDRNLFEKYLMQVCRPWSAPMWTPFCGTGRSPRRTGPSLCGFTNAPASGTSSSGWTAGCGRISGSPSTGSAS